MAHGYMVVAASVWTSLEGAFAREGIGLYSRCASIHEMAAGLDSASTIVGATIWAYCLHGV